MASIPANISDAELIRRVKGGDKKAFKFLYQKYSGLVYTLALKILNQPHEAEDLTQEVFLTFWKKDQFDPHRGSLSTYLCLMVRSRALNQIKSNTSRQNSIERLKQNIPSQLKIAIPLEQATLKEQEETVKQALAKLPPKQRQVLEMNFYQGLSHSSIAVQLEMPLGTVKTNARQGLIKLRSYLGTVVG